jgi:hypothetical protein
MSVELDDNGVSLCGKYKLVPVEPTVEMITAATPNDDLDITWQKMIAAAPKPGEMK